MTRLLQLRCYKLTHDMGFAPNPFGCTLTLATCKPGIRRVATEGEWIAGFTSKALLQTLKISRNEEGDEFYKERLIYLMRIKKRITFNDYYTDPEFKDKIPQLLNGKENPEDTGDNIYFLNEGQYVQKANYYHGDDEKDHDLGLKNGEPTAEYVLIADKFYYFGKDAISIPKNACNINIPSRQNRYGSITTGNEVQKFIDWVNEKANGKLGILGKPHGRKLK